MSEINSPNVSAQPASLDNHEWYYSETDKAPIAKKSEHHQLFLLLKYHLLILFYFMQVVIMIVRCLNFPLTSKWLKEWVSIFLLVKAQRVFFFLRFTCWIVGWGQRYKQTSKFDKVLQQEKLDEWGNSSLKPPLSVPTKKRSSRKLKKLRTGNPPHDLSDKDDSNFDDSSSETESVESGDTSQIPNDEVCHNFISNFINLIQSFLYSGCVTLTIQVYTNLWWTFEAQAFPEDSHEKIFSPHSFSACVCRQSWQCDCYRWCRWYKFCYPDSGCRSE